MSNPAYTLIGSNKAEYPFSPEGLTIGRHRSNDVIINDRKVSRKHACLFVSGGQVWVRDEGSLGGTYVNGERIQGEQPFNPGDVMQVGNVTFRLATGKTTGAAAIRPKNKGLVIGLASVAVILFLFFALTRGGGTESFGFLPYPTDTLTPSPVLDKTTPLVPTDIPAPSETAPPAYDASITCKDLDELRAIRQCEVKNLASMRDTIWLSFNPFRPFDTNDFTLSVLLPGETTGREPDRQGKLSLGEFGPYETKKITLRMYCGDQEEGCPLTTIAVQLLVDNGDKPVMGPQGQFGVRNAAAAAPTATPTPMKKKTAVATPSDGVGPTPTPTHTAYPPPPPPPPYP